MANLERIVRPVLPPSIRPAAFTPAAQIDDQPIVLSGGGNNPVNLKHARSSSWTKQKRETQYRIYDIVRVYNVKDLRPDDTRNAYDSEVTTHVHMKDVRGIFYDYRYWPPSDQKDKNGRFTQKVLQRNIKEFIASSAFTGG